MSDALQSPDRTLHEHTQVLIELLRADTAKAANLLNSLFQEPIARFCTLYLGNREEGEDAMQDVFCKVLEAKSIPESFRPWVYRVARNHCMNLVRRKIRRGPHPAMPPDSQIFEDQTGELSRMVNMENQQKLRSALETLLPVYREVLILRYGEGLNRAEISEVLEIDEVTVKSRIYTGLKHLREQSSQDREM